MNLDEAAHSYLEQTAARDSVYYTPQWDMVRCGWSFPLCQHMAIETQRTVLSVKTGRGKMGVGSEFCYFDVCPQLDAAVLENRCTLLAELANADIACDTRAHDYTFVSLVLLTEGFTDKALQKNLKRFRIYRQYNRAEGQYGWSACRICVVDLLDGALYGSALAEPLLTRLAGGTPPCQPSIAEKLRERFFG